MLGVEREAVKVAVLKAPHAPRILVIVEVVCIIHLLDWLDTLR